MESHAAAFCMPGRWRWVDYWQPIREVIYFKRAVYSRALHELGKMALPAGLPDETVGVLAVPAVASAPPTVAPDKTVGVSARPTGAHAPPAVA